MNMNAQAYDMYKKATVETVAPEKLLIMLYDGAIKNLDSACRKITEKDIPGAHSQIVKAQNIILELMSTLKMEYEISKQLLPLYEFYYKQLVQANVKKDTALLQQVKGYLVELRTAWDEAAKSLHKGGAFSAESTEAPSAALQRNQQVLSSGKLNIQG